MAETFRSLSSGQELSIAVQFAPKYFQEHFHFFANIFIILIRTNVLDTPKKKKKNYKSAYMVGQSYSRASRIWSPSGFSPTTFLIKWPTRLPQVSTRHRVTQKNRKGCSEQFWSAKPCSIDAARRDTSIAGLKPFRKFLQRSTAHFLSELVLYGV